MSEFGFPRQTLSQQTGRIGEVYLEKFVTSDLGWIYRPVHGEHDFGIDGFLEVVLDGNVTGRGLALQIKCGDSYISKTTDGGIRYEGSSRHMNYYLNHNLPVIFVVLNSNCDQGYWVEFDVSKTNGSSDGWWIEIPKHNKLDTSVKSRWSLIAGPVQDYSNEVRQLWMEDTVLAMTDIRFVVIPRREVIKRSMKYIEDFISQISKTKELTLANRGMLEICFEGYDFDPREVYDIDEIREWMVESIEYGIPWFYFLNTQWRGDSLRNLLYCTCNVQLAEASNDKHLLFVDPEEKLEWFYRNFGNLNRFTDQHDIPLEINHERCDAVMECLNRATGKI